MVNILLERYLGQTSKWLYDEIKNYLNSNNKVIVIPFSFRDSRIHNLTEWETLYSKDKGKFYRDIIDSFNEYGITESNIEFLNYFVDTKLTAKEKIQSANVLYILGGLPDRMYDRLKEFDLIDVILHHNGVVMGYSAGAAIQLAEFHLSPDDDYAEFKYYKGIPFINNFYVEFHFTNSEVQNTSIKKVLKEKQKPVYAMHDKGAIIVENEKVKLFGNVTKFYPD